MIRFFAVIFDGFKISRHFLHQFYAAAFDKRIAQHVFDLGIETAQVIVRPALQGGDDLLVDAKWIGFFGHGARNP